MVRSGLAYGRPDYESNMIDLALGILSFLVVGVTALAILFWAGLLIMGFVGWLCDL